MSTALARIKQARESLVQRALEAPQPVIRLATTFLTEVASIEPFDRAMTLAAQAFTSIFPLLITLAAFLSHGNGEIVDHVAKALSLPDSVRQALDKTVPSSTSEFAAYGIISVLIVLVSATSFSRALGRMYAKAWHVPPSGWNGGWRWIVVIVGISGVAVAGQLLEHAAGSLSGFAGAMALIFLLNSLLWVGVPWLLLVRRIGLLQLIPAGILMGIGSVVLSTAGRIYLPHALKLGAAHFGALGVAFTFIGWLFVVCFVLVIATVLGAVLVLDSDVQAFARSLRHRLGFHGGRGAAPADRLG